MDWAKDDPVRNHVLSVIAVRTWVGRDAVASYHSAAVLHRLDLLESPPSGTVTVTLPADRHWKRLRRLGLLSTARTWRRSM